MHQVARAHNHNITVYDSTNNHSSSILEVAAIRGDVEIAELLVNYAEMNYEFFLSATKYGHEKFITEFLDEDALVFLINFRPNLFHAAAKNGNLKVIEALFNRIEEFKISPEKINNYINKQDDNGCSFLHIATEENHGHIIEFALAYNDAHPTSKITLNLDLQDKSNVTFIQRAVMIKGEDNAVLTKIPPKLIEQNADNNIDVQSIIALNELADAIAKQSDTLDDIIQRIIQKRPPEVQLTDQEDDEVSDVEDFTNPVDGDGNTALHIAVTAGDVDVITRILKAVPYALFEINKNGQSPFHLACQNGHVEIVKVLMEESEYIPKELVSRKDKDKNSPLQIACKEGHEQLVSWLLEQCPENYRKTLIASDNAWGQNLLHLAAFHGLPDLVDTILAIETVDAELDQNLLTKIDSFGQTVLHYAVLSGNTKTVSNLLNVEQIDLINQADNDGADPLLLAVTQDDGHMLSFLLQTLKISEDNNNRFYSKSKGYDPLIAFSVSGNHLAATAVLIEELLKAGRDIDELSLGQSSEFPAPLTPLAIAMNMGHTACAELLLKNGADLYKARSYALTAA